MTKIKKELEALRGKLLDLSLSNNLLNYSVSKARTVEILNESVSDIYNRLVVENKSMRFKPLQNSDSIQEKEYIYTKYAPDEIEDKLFYVNNQAQAVFEDQGYQTLFMAIGFLEWTDSGSTKKVLHAPLILVPVALKRSGLRRIFSIEWTQSDLTVSITLKAKMAEMGIEIPEFENQESSKGIEEYFELVEKNLKQKSKSENWKVKRVACIDFFNFKKFVMYKDLDPAIWPEGEGPENHPLIRKLLDPNPDESEGFSESDVDKKLTPEDVYHIVDADSSQIAVIEDVKAGRNLVVEGPPGTGKSQTITNLIAELLGQNKSVLFVSEKMAALQVVKQRLDTIGLGDLCLEIHSNKAQRKELLNELERTVNAPKPPENNYKHMFDEIENIKYELNEYARALKEIVGPSDQSVYEIYGMRERIRRDFEKSGREMQTVFIESPEKWTKEDWINSRACLERMAGSYQILGTVKNSPWSDCEPGIILPPDIIEIKSVMEKLESERKGLFESFEDVIEQTGLQIPESIKDTENMLNLAAYLANFPKIEASVLKNEDWFKNPKVPNSLIQKCTRRLEFEEFIENTFSDRIEKVDTEEFLKRSSKFTRFLDSEFKSIRDEIESCYIVKKNRKLSEINSDIKLYNEFFELENEIKKQDENGYYFFGKDWPYLKNEPEKLKSVEKFVKSFKEVNLKVPFSEDVILKIESGIDKSKVISAKENVETHLKDMEISLKKLSERLGIPKSSIFEKDMTIRGDINYKDLSNRIQKWNESLEDLVLWSRYRSDRAECLNSIAKPFVKMIDEDLILPEEIIPTFKGNYADGILRYAFKQNRSLSTFIREVHENKIDKFIEYDKTILLKNRERLRVQGYENLPRMNIGVSRESEKGILLNEFNKKSGHLPIRKLMLNAGGLIQKIKPCFMMSPLSIAQYLDPKTSRFDVIIFDEASQVRPEDALGALLRGKQVVVMGDTKQLPPSAFFDNMFVNDEYFEEDVYTDMESVLNMCKRSFPHKTLLWHYRSRHESLIEVSNRELYSDRLYVYPSPHHNDKNMGLHLSYNPETVYERGKTGVNRKEAEIVAREVMKHFIRFPDKTLGVGTFNTKQQQAVQYEVEKLIRESPGFEKYLINDKGENFFVKNIETIQGDERDVIFVSVGFGFDHNGKLTNNFGPVNKEGGERRLNVLFTRAREKCVIFSNFRAIDMKIGENSPPGLTILAKFLESAEYRTSNLDSISDGTVFSKDSFESAVLKFLKENGYIVHTRIGCAGYRIDMALESEKNTGYFYLGVECDGPQYYSSEVARDRDRLRKQVLEGLGWNLYRVWSTEWYMSPEKCKRDLLKAVEDAKEKAKGIKIESERVVKEKDSDGKVTVYNKDAVEKMKRVLEEADIEQQKEREKKERELEEEEERKKKKEERELRIKELREEEEQRKEQLREIEEREIERRIKEEEKERVEKEREQRRIEREEEEQKEMKRRDAEIREKEDEEEKAEEEKAEEEKAEVLDESDEETEREKIDDEEDDLNQKSWGDFEKFESSEIVFEDLSKTEDSDNSFRVSGVPTFEDLLNIESMLENGVLNYEKYDDLNLPSTENLGEIPRHTLEHEIVDLVKFEGPVHKERIIRAIRDKCDIKRMSKVTREMIIREILMAEMSGYIFIRGNIIWPPYKKGIVARKRDGDLLDIDYIPEQEVFQMAIYVLASQFSMPKESLIKQISVEFGFKVMRERVRTKIEEVVDKAIEKGYIVILPTGKLYLYE